MIKSDYKKKLILISLLHMGIGYSIRSGVNGEPSRIEDERTEQPLGRARGGEAVVPRSRREDVGYVHPSNPIPREVR